MNDVIILGSGPAGLTAALYCARGGKSALVLGGNTLGGQMATIAELENYPGFLGSGLELAEKMKLQAEKFGAKVILASAKAIKTKDSGFAVITDDGKECESRAVIIATGASPRKLEIAGAREFLGRGVSYCATCDGFFYSGRDVIVIGGGNAALNDALYLANIAKSVKIVYRKDSFARAEKILVDRINATGNIFVLWNTELAEVGGDESGVTFAITTGGDKIAASGVFVAIGHEANTDYLTEDIKRDAMGRLAPNALPQGIFVAGDVRSELKMQIATAVGTGCECAMDAVAYLNSIEN
ncbi:MAG: FAD-dependent oxidoreductase [Alphaproteobacteria bacterium]|nr:FAD-dependent oxidoreductase [Alphaproteobacteria bacterium]